MGSPKCSTCCSTGSGRRLWNVSPASSSTGSRLAMRHAGGGDHVGRAGPDRRRGDHDLAAPHRLGEADRGQRHPLLVLAAPRRQLVAGLLQRLAEAGHVAVAEDREHAGEQRRLASVDDGRWATGTDDRLGGRQPDGLHGQLSLSDARRLPSGRTPTTRSSAACTLHVARRRPRSPATCCRPAATDVRNSWSSMQIRSSKPIRSPTRARSCRGREPVAAVTRW